jgi:hypothetical protein
VREEASDLATDSLAADRKQREARPRGTERRHIGEYSMRLRIAPATTERLTSMSTSKRGIAAARQENTGSKRLK